MLDHERSQLLKTFLVAFHATGLPQFVKFLYNIHHTSFPKPFTQPFRELLPSVNPSLSNASLVPRVNHLIEIDCSQGYSLPLKNTIPLKYPLTFSQPSSRINSLEGGDLHPGHRKPRVLMIYRAFSTPVHQPNQLLLRIHPNLRSSSFSISPSPL